MAPIELVLDSVAVASVVLAMVASRRVVAEHSGFGRSAAQLAFVWLLPIIGPLVTFQLLRREPEQHHLTEADNPGEVPGNINQRYATFHRHGELESDHSSTPEASHGPE